MRTALAVFLLSAVAQAIPLEQSIDFEADARDLREAIELGIPQLIQVSGLPDRAQAHLAAAIVRESKKNGLDPLLTVAVIRTESAFDNYAVSKVGALGLMQVMPATGRYWADKRNLRLGRATNLFDAELNIELGTSYLAELIKRFDGSIESALCAYNVGPNAAKALLKIRAQRQRLIAGYPAKVLMHYRRLKELRKRV